MNYEEYKTVEEERIKRNILLLEEGVIITDIKNAYIDPLAKIGEGTVIEPNVLIQGNTVIGKNCIIGAGTKIKSSLILDNTKMECSVIVESKIGHDTTIGPFAYIRPGSQIGNNCKIGDFVEVKNSKIGDGTKASHLSYIGDSDLGENINVGCGVIFVNYNGKEKFRSTVEDNVFIGCNCNIISPVTLKEQSYIAAGSTVTGDVPKGALYVAREKGRIIEGWVERKGILKKKRKEE